MPLQHGLYQIIHVADTGHGQKPERQIADFQYARLTPRVFHPFNNQRQPGTIDLLHTGKVQADPFLMLEQLPAFLKHAHHGIEPNGAFDSKPPRTFGRDLGIGWRSIKNQAILPSVGDLPFSTN